MCEVGNMTGRCDCAPTVRDPRLVECGMGLAIAIPLINSDVPPRKL